MSDDPKAAAILRRLLAGTREEELDCDRFFALLAPYLDGRIGDDELCEQIAHHAHDFKRHGGIGADRVLVAAAAARSQRFPDGIGAAKIFLRDALGNHDGVPL